MTDEKKYLELLKALAEVITDKNEEIYFYKLQIENLKKQLDDAYKVAVKPEVVELRSEETVCEMK